MAKTYNVGNCAVEIVDSGEIKFEGLLIQASQLEPFQNFLNEVKTLPEIQDAVTINLIECEECISLLLKPFLLWAHGDNR